MTPKSSGPRPGGGSRLSGPRSGSVLTIRRLLEIVVLYQFGLEEISELVQGEASSQEELVPLAFNVQVILFLGYHV
jgi:hypothetical protein